MADRSIRDHWLEHHTAVRHGDVAFVHTQCPRAECADGFSLSVQASMFHYCTPRTYLDDGTYSEWEVGFPSAADDRLTEYAEEPARPTDTVYGYVPTAIINEVIRSHGGLKQAVSISLPTSA